MQPFFHFRAGQSPLLVSMPHVGITLPDDISIRMTDEAKLLPDTDWNIHRVYDFLEDLGASTLQANYSRYVVDLNRSPEGKSLYPGQNVTEICPTTLFDMKPIYQDNNKPTKDEVLQRIELYWKPYHHQLKKELERIKARFGYALLWDAHSIRSQVPRFFDGELPDFNWGSADECSCDVLLSEKLLNQTLNHSPYSAVLNGRFKGGYITRHYGDPNNNIHAIQLELSQLTYMSDEQTFQSDPQKISALKLVLTDLIEIMLEHFT